MPRLTDLIRDFLSPDSAELNLGVVKLKFADQSRTDVRRMLNALRSKRVLVAKMDDEIWEYVFSSLHKLRDLFVELADKMTSNSTSDIRSLALRLVDLVTAYLAEYESDYIRFMSGPKYPALAKAHKERNWPELGDAAEDLLSLRRLISEVTKQLSVFVGDKLNDEEQSPEYSGLNHWIRYAKARTFCPNCGFNMTYAYKDTCPACRPEDIPAEIRSYFHGEYGKA